MAAAVVLFWQRWDGIIIHLLRYSFFSKRKHPLQEGRRGEGRKEGAEKSLPAKDG